MLYIYKICCHFCVVFFQRGFSALMYAVEGNHLHVVKELVLSQAELKIRDKVCMEIYNIPHYITCKPHYITISSKYFIG